MTKPGKMHCFIWIQTKGEQVKTRLNLPHWGSWDTVKSTKLFVDIDGYM